MNRLLIYFPSDAG